MPTTAALVGSHWMSRKNLELLLNLYLEVITLYYTKHYKIEILISPTNIFFLREKGGVMASAIYQSTTHYSHTHTYTLSS